MRASLLLCVFVVWSACDGAVAPGEGEGEVVGEGEGEGVGEGEVVVGEGEGEGEVVVGEGEGEGDVVVGEGEGEGEVVVGEGEGEGDVVVGEGEGEGDVGFVMPDRAVCGGRFGDAENVGFSGGAVAEASGVVASPTTPGLLWLHNDSGDTAQLYAVTTAGRVLGALQLPGVVAVDFEDLAAAPCPDRSGACLYVADTGDNLLERDHLAVYAVNEPVVDTGVDFGSVEGVVVGEFDFTVSGGAANIEAFVVMPDASAMVFFEKKNDGARILRLDAPFVDVSVGTDVATVSGTFDTPGTGTNLRVVTGADLHVDGTRLLLRTYQAVFQATVSGVPDAVTTADLVEVARPLEAQGEAIAFDEDGTGLWSVSEQVAVGGFTLPNTLHHTPCLP